MEFRIGLSVLGCCVLLVSACQTLSKEECIAADWLVVGEQDGAQGVDPQSRFGQHAKSCEKAGVVPDQSAWNAGYQKGLRRYCTPLNGLAQGQKAATYNNVCPADLASGFDRGYRLGLNEKKKRDEINSLNNRIRASRSTIENNRKLIAEGKIDQAEGEYIIRTEERQINDFNRQIGRKQAELKQIRRRIDDFRFSQRA